MNVHHPHVVTVPRAMIFSMVTSVNALKVSMEQTVNNNQHVPLVLHVQHVLSVLPAVLVLRQLLVQLAPIAQHKPLHALPAQMLLLKILLHVLYVLKLQQVPQAHAPYVLSVQQLVPPALSVQRSPPLLLKLPHPVQLQNQNQITVLMNHVKIMGPASTQPEDMFVCVLDLLVAKTALMVRCCICFKCCIPFIFRIRCTSNLIFLFAHCFRNHQDLSNFRTRCRFLFRRPM